MSFVLQCPPNLHKQDGYPCQLNQVKCSPLEFVSELKCHLPKWCRCVPSCRLFAHLLQAFHQNCCLLLRLSLIQGRCYGGECKTRDSQCKYIWGSSKLWKTMQELQKRVRVKYWPSHWNTTYSVSLAQRQEARRSTATKSWTQRARKKETAEKMERSGSPAANSKWHIQLSLTVDFACCASATTTKKSSWICIQICT